MEQKDRVLELIGVVVCSHRWVGFSVTGRRGLGLQVARDSSRECPGAIGTVLELIGVSWSTKQDSSSPYSDGSKFDLWTLEAERYRVWVLYEFLRLTLEKRASIHHIMELKEEFSLTKHTYQMLSKQPRMNCLAGKKMN